MHLQRAGLSPIVKAGFDRIADIQYSKMKCITGLAKVLGCVGCMGSEWRDGFQPQYYADDTSTFKEGAVSFL